MRKWMKVGLVVCVLVVVVLVGCSSPTLPTPTPVSVPIPMPKPESIPNPIPEPIPELEPEFETFRFGDFTIDDGAVIIDGFVVVKGNWEPIILTDNSSSTNPTYARLKAFLRGEEKTDAHDYILSFTTKADDESYICGDFAEAVHNNAEAVGIRAGLVEFPDINHVANVFETTDKGLILVDCTGEFWLKAVANPFTTVSFGEPITWDKVAYFEKGKPLGFIEMSVAEIYGFSYSGYELWKQKKADFQRVFDSLPNEITSKEARELRELAKDLGGFFEEEEIVYSYTIVWEGKLLRGREE